MEQAPYWPQKIVLLRTSLLYCYTPTYPLRVVLVWSKSKADRKQIRLRTTEHFYIESWKSQTRKNVFLLQKKEKWNFEQKREEITFQWHSFFLAEKFKLRNFLKIEMICIKEENTYD